MVRRHAPKVTALLALASLATANPDGSLAQQPLARDTGLGPPLRVASFNIRYGTANDGPDRWELRRESVVELLRRVSADIVGVQEALRFQLDELHRALPGYGELGVGRDDGRSSGEYAAILYRTDRFAVVDSGTFWFSDTPEIPGSRTWGNAVTRICTWARLRDRRTGRRLFVFNVHLDHESQYSREQSVRMLVRRITFRRPRDAVIALGDFNAGESNPAIAMMREHLVDTFREANPHDSVAGTFNGFRGDSTGERIDYIFADSSLVVRRAAIVRDRPGGRWPSDHFPVVAELAWRLDARPGIAPSPRGPLTDLAEGGRLDGIVVTTTRFERRVEDQAHRVEVVGPGEVEEKLAMTPGDVAMLLNETPGLQVRLTAPSLGAAAVRVRGLAGRYTQTLSDALPLHGPTGSFGLLQIPPLDLLQVEIVKGTASALYGAQALGGIVNFVSRRPIPAREVLVNATTQNGQDLGLFDAGPLGGYWGRTVLVSLHRLSRGDRDGDGWTDVAGYERVVVRPRLFHDDPTGLNLFATAGATLENRTGGSLPGHVTQEGVPFEEGLRTRRFDVGTTARAPWGRMLLAARGAAMFQDHRRTFGDSVDHDRRSSAFLELVLSRPGQRLSWLTGAAIQDDRFRSDSTPDLDYSYTAPGLFAQLDLTLERVAASLSARLDHHNRFGTFANPRLSVRWRFAGDWSLRASAGTGYFAPTVLLEEVEASTLRRVDPRYTLVAELGRSASLDLAGSAGPLELDFSLFGSLVEDPAEAGPCLTAGAASFGTLCIANSASRINTTGAEALAGLRRGAVHVVGSLTWVRSRQDGAQLALTPQWTGSLTAVIERGASRLGVEFYGVGRQLLGDNPYRSVSAPYLIVGALLQHRVGRARLFLNLENLGDVRMTRRNPAVRQSRDPITGAWAVGAWAPPEGRVINAGVRVRF